MPSGYPGWTDLKASGAHINGRRVWGGGGSRPLTPPPDPGPTLANTHASPHAPNPSLEAVQRPDQLVVLSVQLLTALALLRQGRVLLDLTHNLTRGAGAWKPHEACGAQW